MQNEKPTPAKDSASGTLYGMGKWASLNPPSITQNFFTVGWCGDLPEEIMVVRGMKGWYLCIVVTMGPYAEVILFRVRIKVRIVRSLSIQEFC